MFFIEVEPEVWLDIAESKIDEWNKYNEKQIINSDILNHFATWINIKSDIIKRNHCS